MKCRMLDKEYSSTAFYIMYNTEHRTYRERHLTQPTSPLYVKFQQECTILCMFNIKPSEMKKT